MILLVRRKRILGAAALLLSVVTALAFHNAIGDQNQLIHLLKNFAMAGGLLQVVAFGAGAYSIDAAGGRKGVVRTA